jgi:cobalt ECF transporter T component CbiQ
LDRTLKRVARFVDAFYLHQESAMKKSLLQKIDARIKLVFLLYYIFLISITSSIVVLTRVSVFLLMLFILSGVNLRTVYLRIFLFSFFFGFLIALPASLNLITPVKMVFSLIHLKESKHFWIYHIPAQIGLTKEGILVVLRLYLKVMNSIALSLLIFYTTHFHTLIKALRSMKVPDLLLIVISLSYKYIFILAHTILETYFALKLRWWKKLSNSQADHIIAGRIAYLFRTSWHTYEEVYMAMVARGFNGRMDFCYYEKISGKDFLFLVFFVMVSLMFYFIP